MGSVQAGQHLPYGRSRAGHLGLVSHQPPPLHLHQGTLGHCIPLDVAQGAASGSWVVVNLLLQDVKRCKDHVCSCQALGLPSCQAHCVNHSRRLARSQASVQFKLSLCFRFARCVSAPLLARALGGVFSGAGVFIQRSQRLQPVVNLHVQQARAGVALQLGLPLLHQGRGTHHQGVASQPAAWRQWGRSGRGASC